MASLFIVMGVSGAGKTTIGTIFSQQINAVFADADDYHSSENKQKMHAGIPLTDEDRLPWLQNLNSLLEDWVLQGTRGVLACSALKESYRQILSRGLPAAEPTWIWLDGAPEMIAARLASRQGTYMNPALLGTQFAILEPPADAVRVVNDRAPDLVVADLMQRLKLVPDAAATMRNS